MIDTSICVDRFFKKLEEKLRCNGVDIICEIYSDRNF
jgi:hypothetical protein